MRATIDSASAAKTQLELITEYYRKDFLNEERQSEFGLHGGRGSTILLLSLLSQVEDDAKKKSAFADLISGNLEYIFSKIENDEHYLPSFCNGLAGVGWLISYLHDNNLFNDDIEEFLSDLDVYLESELTKKIHQGHFDLMHGALGIAMYFLKRQKQGPVLRTIDWLRQIAISDSDEVKWTRFDPFYAKDYLYDFSLAHGNASILYFLGKCYKNGIDTETCKILIDGSLNFFMSNTQNFDKIGSFYPASVKVADYKSSEENFCRLAWCYGDLGILHTIWLVSNWIGNEEISRQALEMLARQGERRQREETYVEDAGFCHGASGVGYIFWHLYQQTSLAVFKDAACFWLEYTLADTKDDAFDKHGYIFNLGDLGWGSNAGILSGVAGVGALLISHLNPNLDSSWNECFFLS